MCEGLCEFRVDDIWIFVPVVDADPHLERSQFVCSQGNLTINTSHTFLKVLSPARILPPIHVEYFLSGGAKILILMSFTANLCTSCNSLSPKPFVNVLPPDKTIFPNSDFRRSRSVRFMASTTIWWMPGYSRPMISGSKRISGARNRSAPIFLLLAVYLHVLNLD